MKTIAAAGNTVAPAILALEALGFLVQVERDSSGDRCRATRDGDTYVAIDPVELLGLVKLVEVRGWNWSATDDELDSVFQRVSLDRCDL